jgi:methionyl-tRNA formyltransferase
LDCQPIAESYSVTGTVTAQEQAVFISCGSGSLQLFTIQLEGKHAVSILDFMNGHRTFIGAVLS